MEKTKAEEKFEKEINDLKIVGYVNVKGKQECLIFFRRFIHKKWLNSWARYSGRLPSGKMKTSEIRAFMIDKGQIGY